MLQEHFMLCGSPGAGKSVLIRSILRQIRARGEIAIVYDIETEYVQEFYDAGRGDVILNPLDGRAPHWNPWLELRPGQPFDSDCEALAGSLIRGGDPRGEFFRASARTLFKVLLRKAKTIKQLLDYVTMDIAPLHKALRDTPARNLINPGALPQSIAILGTLLNPVNTFRHLPGEGTLGGAWCAREWAAKPQGWLFLTSKAVHVDAVRPLQGLWLDALTRELIARESDMPRVWIIADELPTLGYQPNILTLLTRGRKRNLPAVIGFQNISQVRASFGREEAITLSSAAATKIILRNDEPETAKWASDLIGSEEVLRTDTSTGELGTGPRYNEHTTTRHIVSPAEIQKLKKLRGYLAVASHDRTALKVPRCWLEQKHPAYIARIETEATTEQKPVVEDPTEGWTLEQIKETRNSYDAARRRCNDADNASWPWYGGRGQPDRHGVVRAEGPPVEFRFADFFDFVRAMKSERSPTGSRPPGCKVGRLNEDPSTGQHHYQWGNVAWMTDAENRANRRKNKKGGDDTAENAA
jgi:hypothetical protein